MAKLEHNGRTLSYLDEGAGPPALLLHSGGLSSRQWRGLLTMLKPTNRVLAPDFLGYGGSSPFVEGSAFHFREDVEMLAALLATFPEPVHLVGHSYGGLLALQLALRDPSRVRSMALFEPVAFGILHDPTQAASAPGLGSDELAVMQAMADDQTGAGGGEVWMEGFVDWWQGKGVWRSLPEPSRTAFLTAGRKTFMEVKSLLSDRTPAAAYLQITAPSLILTGSRSPEVEQRVCARLAEALPHGRMETLANAGHMAPLTNVAQVNGLIAAHLLQS